MPKGEQGVDNEVSITIRGREQVACVMEALHKAGYVHAQANGQPTASTLEKLRELEARWRNPEWARAHISDDRPSEFICADELHAILAPAPRSAEKD